MKISKITLTLYFLIKKTGTANHSSRDIFNAGHDAAEYFNSLLPPEVTKKLTEIKEKHGFTEDSWESVMQQSGSFFFLPSEDANKCNKAIRKYLSSFIITNGAYYSYSVFSGNLTSLFQRGGVRRTEDFPKKYYLSQYTINRIEEALKNQKA